MNSRLVSTLAVVLVLNGAHAAEHYDFGAVEQRITREIDKKSIPSMVVSVAKDGKIVYERAFGYADVEKKTPATVSTAYRLGSISKPLAATGLMTLYQKGKVDLDAPAERYMAPLKFLSPGGAGNQVTLRHLLNHSSGLGPYFQYAFDGYAKYGDSFEVAFGKYGSILHPPGALMDYSNMGFGLIGIVIAKQSLQPLPVFMQRQVFAPLGMRDSFFETSPDPKIQIAVGYNSELHRLPELFDNTSAAGAGYSSAHDLILFAMFHLNPATARHPILTTDNVALMRDYVGANTLYPFYKGSHYGLGWYVRDDDSGYRTVWHEGGMPGASSNVKMVPKAQIAAAALTNVGDKNPLVESIVNDLITVILPAYHPEPLNATADYQEYKGGADYLGKWSGVIEVAGRDIPCSLTFDASGDIHASYAAGGQAGSLTEVKFRGMVQKDSFLGSFSGTLPAADMPAGVTPILVLLLIKDGNVLAGRISAYNAAAETLQFFHPFYIRLERDPKE